MPPLKTPICDFGTNAKDFNLNSTDNKLISLNDIKGDTGTLIMFICNHCPYVKAVIEDIVEVVSDEDQEEPVVENQCHLCRIQLTTKDQFYYHIEVNHVEYFRGMRRLLETRQV